MLCLPNQAASTGRTPTYRLLVSSVIAFKHLLIAWTWNWIDESGLDGEDDVAEV
jgi:hypothetical protein